MQYLGCGRHGPYFGLGISIFHEERRTAPLIVNTQLKQRIINVFNGSPKGQFGSARMQVHVIRLMSRYCTIGRYRTLRPVDLPGIELLDQVHTGGGISQKRVEPEKNGQESEPATYFHLLILGSYPNWLTVGFNIL
jgi:hypothetical protein